MIITTPVVTLSVVTVFDLTDPRPRSLVYAGAQCVSVVRLDAEIESEAI
jgi:hypothetical protein